MPGRGKPDILHVAFFTYLLTSCRSTSTRTFTALLTYLQASSLWLLALERVHSRVQQ